MLKADLARVTALASDDEATRVAAAATLAALPPRYFLSHDIDKKRLPPGWLAAMAAAWRDTSSANVRTWVAQAVALSRAWPCDPVMPLLLEFLDIDGDYLQSVAIFVLERTSRQPESRDRLLALHRHRDPQVRGALAARLAWMVQGEGLDYAVAAPVMRAFLRDASGTVRHDAVMMAEQHVDRLGPEDAELLLDVVNLDSGARRVRTQQLLDALAARRPDCAPANFAPRTPRLRSDGMYTTDVTELDHAGRWVTLRCLRFFDDGSVHGFGTDEAPVDLPKLMPHRTHDIAQGTVRREGATLSFTLRSVDYTGHIDGSTIAFTSVDRATGLETQAEYAYTFIDWNAPPPPAPATPAVPTKKPRGKAAAPLPFERLRPESLRIADAAKWYLLMVPRLPLLVSDLPDDQQRFERAWFLKNEMRATAARSLYDPSLKGQLLAAMALPDASEMLRSMSPADALRALATVTPGERRAFPGTVGEAIGLTYHGRDGVFVMTEQGWQRQ